MLDDDGRSLGHPYFHSATPQQYEVAGSYADPNAPFSDHAFEWAHSLSEVLTALMGAGMTILEFREYPYSPYGCFPFLEESEPGRWTVRGARVELPVVFSLHAGKGR
jgi:hypothetical protein